MGDVAELWHLFDAVLAVIAGAVAAGLATRLLVEPYKAQTQERLTRVESDLTGERDERKALRDRVEAKEAKRFDLLHEWRAQAMSDTYSALCVLQDAHDEFSNSFGGLVDGPTPKNYWEQLTKAGSAFREAFWDKRILFDRDLADNLTLLNRAYVEISNSFWAKYNAGCGSLRGSEDTEKRRRRVEYDVLSDILHSEKYRTAVRAITVLQSEMELGFRSLFGVA